MNKRITLVLAALLGVAAAGLQAQSFQEGFFLNEYRLGYRYNPALASGTDFISIGEYSANTRSNIGADAFLYPRNGEVVTGLHSSIPAEEFLSRIQERNYTVGSINYNLIAYGFARGDAFRTVELNARALYSATLPREYFQLLKTGSREQFYDLTHSGDFAQLYAELAYGYSRRLSDVVSIGVRGKLLVGLESIDYRPTKVQLFAEGNEYRLDVDAMMNITSRSGKMPVDENGNLKPLSSQAREKWPLPSGIGAAVDVGVVITPNRYLTISASVNDLGALCWYYGNAGRAQNSFSFSGVPDLAYNEFNADGLIDKARQLAKEYYQQLSLKAVDKHIEVDFVPLRANLGIKYALPFYERIRVGAVANYVGFRNMPYMEARGGVAYNPFSWLDFTVNAGYGTYGPVYGFAGSVRILKFRINFGIENGTGGTIPYRSTPLKANSKTMTVGVTFDI